EALGPAAGRPRDGLQLGPGPGPAGRRRGRGAGGGVPGRGPGGTHLRVKPKRGLPRVARPWRGGPRGGSPPPPAGRPRPRGRGGGKGGVVELEVTEFRTARGAVEHARESGGRAIRLGGRNLVVREPDAE